MVDVLLHLGEHGGAGLEVVVSRGDDDVRQDLLEDGQRQQLRRRDLARLSQRDVGISLQKFQTGASLRHVQKRLESVRDFGRASVETRAKESARDSPQILFQAHAAVVDGRDGLVDRRPSHGEVEFFDGGSQLDEVFVQLEEFPKSSLHAPLGARQDVEHPQNVHRVVLDVVGAQYSHAERRSQQRASLFRRWWSLGRARCSRGGRCKRLSPSGRRRHDVQPPPLWRRVLLFIRRRRRHKSCVDVVEARGGRRVVFLRRQVVALVVGRKVVAF
mmetsp:Transcript_108/g.280  ORF Transcript_108/g.280 Transcript_108/m.280 type:complete len:273 (+) Transcript_108:794-1612(+)